MKKVSRLWTLAIFAALIFAQPALAEWGVDIGVGGENWGVELGFGDGEVGGGSGGGEGFYLWNPGMPQGSLLGIVTNTALWLLAIFGVIGVIGFIISGILYLTAAGEEGQITKAKNAMKWSIVGVIVGLMGFVIIQAVSSWLSGANTIF